MPNPTIIELYDFETQIEGAVKTILVAGMSAVGLPAVSVHVTRDSDTQESPRLEVTFETGQADKQMTAIGQSDPKQVPAAYYGALTVKVVTQRPTDNARMDTLHGPLRGAVRWILSAGHHPFNDSNLPWLQVMLMLPAHTGTQLQDEKEWDIDAIVFNLRFAINNAAWPHDT